MKLMKLEIIILDYTGVAGRGVRKLEITVGCYTLDLLSVYICIEWNWYQYLKAHRSWWQRNPNIGGHLFVVPYRNCWQSTANDSTEKLINWKFLAETSKWMWLSQLWGLFCRLFWEGYRHAPSLWINVSFLL